MITIKKGLNLPIKGEPKQDITNGNPIKTVALLGADYVGLKPTMTVKIGDKVKLGQPLFEDKKTPGIIYTSPGTGTVIEINRGERRKLLSVVIKLEQGEAVNFHSFTDSKLDHIQRKDIEQQLIQSGEWTLFRTRPFSKVPALGTSPHAIFITVMDTHPLAAKVDPILNKNLKDFTRGVKIISKLTQGKIFICKAPETDLPNFECTQIQVEVFKGKHPAGLTGTHIHFLDPVHAHKTVWSINYQDVIAIGYLFRTGQILTNRVISLAGPSVKSPRLIQTHVGANVDELVQNELKEGEHRVISGSVLSGIEASGKKGYLGRYHQQISVIEENRKREFLGWMSLGFNNFSIKNIFASKLFPYKKFNFTTTENGSPRAMVPVGTYEKVMPLDIQPTFLLRSLIVKDTDQAQALGCLELDEEDLGLCTFVCPGKYNYGTILRENLTKIEQEG